MLFFTKICNFSIFSLNAKQNIHFEKVEKSNFNPYFSSSAVVLFRRTCQY